MIIDTLKEADEPRSRGSAAGQHSKFDVCALPKSKSSQFKTTKDMCEIGFSAADLRLTPLAAKQVA